ncbi:MAG: hypothetical protein ABEI57_00435 [Halapricum sp.]
MFGIESMGAPAQAAFTVGVVLTEAAALYVVYGLLSAIAGSTVLDAVGGE